MEMEMEIKDNNQISDFDIKSRIMDKIKEENIKIKDPLLMMAQKVGLQSILALFIFGGALLMSMMLYILKKIGALKLLQLGMPGLKVLLLSLPYDHIALFLICIILANYIAKKLDFSNTVKNYLDISALGLLLITVLLGVFFAVMGGGELLKCWY